MKLNKHILEAINRGIKLALDDYEEDINAIDEALSYAISEHEKDIKAIDEES